MPRLRSLPVRTQKLDARIWRTRCTDGRPSL